ncbi:MAG: cytochrome c oxidase subunit 3, partial [Methyloligellaceae bacterium]
MADAHAENKHDYHLVDPSPWPAVGAFGAFILALGAVKYFVDAKAGTANAGILIPGFAIVLATMFFWWRDVIAEAHKGDHTPVVSIHLRYGMIMFIASEVMFFVAWFWAFFDAALFPGDVSTIKDTG